MTTITLDRFDLALLDALQHNGNATNAVLGETVHLSASQISRRLQRLADIGIITGYAALLDPAAIGLGVTAFAQVILERHGKAPSEAFENAAVAITGSDGMPFAQRRRRLTCCALSLSDLQAFSELMMKRILRLPGVAHIKTNIALQKVKQTHVLPLDHIAQLGRPRQQLNYAGD